MKTKQDGFLLRRKDSAYWWASYSRKGKECRKSTKVEHLLTPDGTPTPGKSPRKVAAAKAAAIVELKRLTHAVEDERTKGTPFLDTPELRKLTVGDLLANLEADLRTRGKFSGPMASHFKHAREYFGDFLATSLSRRQVDDYINQKKSCWRPASINRVTCLIRQCYKLGKQDGIIQSAPYVSRVSERGNARQGFVTPPVFAKLWAELPLYLQAFAALAYAIGWRKSELASLGWTDVGTDGIRIDSGRTKDGRARFVPIDFPGVREVLAECRANRVPGCTLLFHNQGRPLGDFRWAWWGASVRAGTGFWACPKCKSPQLEKLRHPVRFHCSACHTDTAPDHLDYEGVHLHDFRRSAGRNMALAGWPQGMIMRITGHATASMFQRYQIFGASDFSPDMLQRLAGYTEPSRPLAPAPPAAPAPEGPPASPLTIH